MRLRKWLLGFMVLGLALLSVAGCDNDNNNNNNADMDFDYPLAIGNSWQYDRIFSVFYDSTAHSNGMIDEVYNGVGSVEIMGSELLFDNIEVYDFASSLSEEGHQPYLSNSYYNYDETSLIRYGYIDGSILNPKSDGKKVFYNFDNKKFNNPQEMVAYLENGLVRNSQAKNDTLYYDPVKCFVYPMSEDLEWNYRVHNDVSVIKKTVLGIEEVDVPAGKFECWKIESTYSDSVINDEIDFFEYVSQEGLVKRVIEYSNIEITDEDGNLIGSEDGRDEQYLTDYQIAE